MNLEPVIRTMQERAEQSIPVTDGDYQVDGLWYCGKCNTPKQCRIQIFGATQMPMCLCKCKSAELEDEDAFLREQAQKAKIERMRKACFPESEMSGWTFGEDDQSNSRLSTLAHGYAEHFMELRQNGKGLLLFGTVGTGKTFASACVANALIDHGIPCLMAKASRIVNKVTGMLEEKQSYIDSLNRFDLLILDDLGSERTTEYANEIVQDVIDSRYRARLPIIVTTNLSADELKRPAELFRQRMFSRLMEMCFPFEVTGKDRRKEKLKTEYSDMEILLGLQN